jgi:hypothetical protein
MLNDDFKAEKKETVEFTPLPEDMYTVELLDVNPKKTATYDTKNLPDDQKEYETVLDFQFVLLEGTENGKGLRGRSVFLNYVPSFLYVSKKNGKNKLYQVVEALQGHPITPEQEAYGITGPTLNGLIGKPCRVVIVNTVKDQTTYSNIDRLLPAKETYPLLTAEEKEKATIKEKTADTTPEEIPEISAEDIPFN